ncbi:MAG: arginine repressor [Chloroflexi bacterium]|nr:arginine repressor [Chloroflexota bacterium]
MSGPRTATASHGLSGPNGLPGLGAKPDRQRVILEIVAGEPIASQHDLADRLAGRGYAVTQATISRDIAELSLAKAWRGDRHVYVLEAEAGRLAAGSDERLARILADIPVQVGRSGLILVLTGSPGTASVIAQAIDESTLAEQVGTVAGDNTLLVLFADEPALGRWLDRFSALQSTVAAGAGTEGSR